MNTFRKKTLVPMYDILFLSLSEKVMFARHAVCMLYASLTLYKFIIVIYYHIQSRFVVLN